jgi:hypothetical protein
MSERFAVLQRVRVPEDVIREAQDIAERSSKPIEEVVVILMREALETRRVRAPVPPRDKG